LAVPFIWTGVEYFRSELYYLRFSWLNVGYAFSSLPRSALIPWLGMYGIGFVLMLFAAQWPFRKSASRGQKWRWSFAFLLLIACAVGLGGIKPSTGNYTSSRLRIAGVQLEFPDENTVVTELNKLLVTSPETDLFLLSEYTFSGPVPVKVRNWCAKNHKYLIAGGKDFADRTETQFRNTAFVIGPNGEQVFSQVKAVPIQFFKDGLPAAEQKLWDSPWGKIGLCVCYDLSYTRITDELICQGAQAIIAPTMDVEEWGERQHRLHARVAPIRAAEYGVPIFRLCSSGISQAVSATGAVLETAPFSGQGKTLLATLDLSRRGTRPLDRFLAWPCVAVCAVLLLWHIAYSFRPKRRA
jgi:apolipoprotein N-acyltransferase